MNDTIARLFEWIQIISNIAAEVRRSSAKITQEQAKEITEAICS